MVISLMSVLFCSLSATLITNTSVATQITSLMCRATPPSWCILETVLGQMEVVNTKTTVFNLFNISSTLGNIVVFCQFVKPIL
jgi:hypothetical protein